MAGLENLRILGFGNPLLDISAVVEQDVLDKAVPDLIAQAEKGIAFAAK